MYIGTHIKDGFDAVVLLYRLHINNHKLLYIQSDSFITKHSLFQKVLMFLKVFF